MSRDCIFCKIVRGEIPSHKILEDENSFAFLDIHPLADGHTMIIPKDHIERFEDVPPVQLGKLFESVQRVTKSLKNSLKAPAVTIGINNGHAAGQVVPHLHIHVIPRFENDGGGSVHSIVKISPTRSLEEVVRLLQSALKN
ncbi:HIT family protein [Candidatus Acetothermia bacterium]|nr:HIT family protein [Candidatus Acetothermia bacterium]MBI3644246.1 HIT family protein [Candidatus Acetothermia bacterium]